MILEITNADIVTFGICYLCFLATTGVILKIIQLKKERKI